MLSLVTEYQHHFGIQLAFRCCCLVNINVIKVYQSAINHTIARLKTKNNFWGGGTVPSPDLFPHWGGETPPQTSPSRCRRLISRFWRLFVKFGLPTFGLLLPSMVEIWPNVPRHAYSTCYINYILT